MQASTKVYGSAESKAGLGGGARKSSGTALAKNAASTVQSQFEVRLAATSQLVDGAFPFALINMVPGGAAPERQTVKPQPA